MKTWIDVLVPAIVGLVIFCALPDGIMRADAAGDPCPNGILPPGNGGDLEITAKACSVRAGTYKYRNVNIWGGGSLTFLDDPGTNEKDPGIHFWATSILVEDGGSLIAGTVKEPIGWKKGS